MNKEKLDSLIRDIKKVKEAEKALQGLEIAGSVISNIDKVIDYALNTRIISTLEDIVYIVQIYPEIADALVKRVYLDNNRGDVVKAPEKIRTEVKYESSINAPYQYNGRGYKSLKDVPGYGTEWNDRCVRDEVYRDRNNQRC